jgi:50S ribosomal subunit-associated GTPase HflX
VLREIGAHETQQILVLNKVDRLGKRLADIEALRARILGGSEQVTKAPPAVAVSALSGEGIPALLEEVDRALPLDPISTVRFRIPHHDGAQMRWLYEFARVLERIDTEEYAEVMAETPDSVRKRLIRYVANGPDES